ncbi:hypothetical protein J5X86_13250 [Streptomyces sp. NEAU-YJ-81]|nr:hypothetical protein [Streptomyces sp. NEAU-YJ-81]
MRRCRSSSARGTAAIPRTFWRPRRRSPHGRFGSFLIPQFLNPRLNRRDDAYGHDSAGRRRLLMEIVDEVAAAWDGRRVGVRLSPYWTAEWFTADERMLADYDALVAEPVSASPASIMAFPVSRSKPWLAISGPSKRRR